MNLKEYLEEKTLQGGFAKLIGLKITDMENGFARGEIAIDERHQNPIGSLHGGVYYTLADVIGGAAAVSRGYLVTTVNSSFSYLRPGIGTSLLYATAKEIKYGKNISVYDVTVFDEKDVALAQGTFTYMSLGTRAFDD